MEENSPNRVYILLLVPSSHRSPGEIYSNPTRKRDFLRGVSFRSRGPISFGQISPFKGLILFRSTKNSFNLLLTRRGGERDLELSRLGLSDLRDFIPRMVEDASIQSEFSYFPLYIRIYIYTFGYRVYVIEIYNRYRYIR